MKKKKILSYLQRKTTIKRLLIAGMNTTEGNLAKLPKLPKDERKQLRKHWMITA